MSFKLRVLRTRKGRWRQRVRGARVSFPSGLARRSIFFLRKGVIFRNTPGPARQPPKHLVCVSRGRVLGRRKFHFAFKSADFVSNKGVDAKSALAPVAVFRYF